MIAIDGKDITEDNNARSVYENVFIANTVKKIKETKWKRKRKSNRSSSERII